MVRQRILPLFVFFLIATPGDCQDPITVKAVAPPFYLPIAAVAGIQGTVEIEVMVGKDGKVSSIISSRSLNKWKQLIPNAEHYAKKWLFSGANDHPVKITFEYCLYPKETLDLDLSTEFVPPRKVIIKSRCLNIAGIPLDG